MIHLFFVPGMHGTMIEYVLYKSVTADPAAVNVNADGSMHSYSKQQHAVELQYIQDQGQHITSTIYPTRQAPLRQILQQCRGVFADWVHQAKVLIFAPDLAWCERNLLFQYHKISLGLGLGHTIFGDNLQDIRCWNAAASSASDLAPWQFREWLSLTYEDTVQEWMHSEHEVGHDFLKVSNRDIMQDTHLVLLDIAAHCGIDLPRDTENFACEYREAQQYVLDEYTRIQCIMDRIRNHESGVFQQLSLAGEAILQNKLRRSGLEIMCHGLDILPTDVVKLTKLLYKPSEEMHA